MYDIDDKEEHADDDIIVRTDVNNTKSDPVANVLTHLLPRTVLLKTIGNYRINSM